MNGIGYAATPKAEEIAMRRYRKIIVTFFLPVAVLLGGVALSNGCAHETSRKPTKEAYAQPREGDRAPVTSTTPAEAASAEAASNDATSAVAAAADAPVMDPASAEKLTNDKIIAIAHAANEGELEEAHLAARRGTDPRVRAYAKEMLRDDKMSDKRGKYVAKADSLAAADSATSDELRRNARKTLEELGQLRGASLDRAYVSAQVKEHSAVLQLIDDRLLPQVTDQNVKDALERIRPAVARHLEQAMTLQTLLKDKN